MAECCSGEEDDRGWPHCSKNRGILFLQSIGDVLKWAQVSGNFFWLLHVTQQGAPDGRLNNLRVLGQRKRTACWLQVNVPLVEANISPTAPIEKIEPRNPGTSRSQPSCYQVLLDHPGSGQGTIG